MRRFITLLTVNVVLAGLLATIPSMAIGAQTCDGRTATIVGTPADDLLEGTNGPDVIVGLGGDDIILGLGGNDRICGGSDDDIIEGGSGRDRLFGGGGDDSIEGGPGNDDIFGYTGEDDLNGNGGRDFVKGGPQADRVRGQANADVLKGNGGPDVVRGGRGGDSLDGGAAVDDCKQGPGSGPVRNCEKADLRVDVIAPDQGHSGSAPFKVRVTNRGPNATSYALFLSEDSGNVTCDPPWDNTRRDQGTLRPGRTRTITLEPECETVRDPGSEAWVEVTARASALALDPRRGNNKDTDRTTIE